MIATCKAHTAQNLVLPAFAQNRQGTNPAESSHSESLGLFLWKLPGARPNSSAKIAIPSLSSIWPSLLDLLFFIHLRFFPDFPDSDGSVQNQQRSYYCLISFGIMLFLWFDYKKSPRLRHEGFLWNNYRQTIVIVFLSIFSIERLSSWIPFLFFHSLKSRSPWSLPFLSCLLWSYRSCLR